MDHALRVAFLQADPKGLLDPAQCEAPGASGVVGVDKRTQTRFRVVRVTHHAVAPGPLPSLASQRYRLRVGPFLNLAGLAESSSKRHANPHGLALPAPVNKLSASTRGPTPRPPSRLHPSLGVQSHHPGEVPERLKGSVSKTDVGFTSPWVRIPPSPLPLLAIPQGRSHERFKPQLRVTSKGIKRPAGAVAAVHEMALGQGVCFSLMRRYSIWPRSPSSPMGPLAGSLRASSSTSPLQVQWATPLFTVTTISFQSWGLYLVNCL